MPKRPTQDTLRRHLANKRGFLIDEDGRAKRAVLSGIPDRRKTAAMLMKEVEFQTPIEVILLSGPLHHYGEEPTCNHCVQCLFGINKATASQWRRKLGLPSYQPTQEEITQESYVDHPLADPDTYEQALFDAREEEAYDQEAKGA